VQVDGRSVRQLTPRLAVADAPDLDKQPAGRTTRAGVDDALRDLGISADEISELRQSGVIH
jgi:hypothetical protein